MSERGHCGCEFGSVWIVCRGWTARKAAETKDRALPCGLEFREPERGRYSLVRFTNRKVS
jgi:hypothetical protein